MVCLHPSRGSFSAQCVVLSTMAETGSHNISSFPPFAKTKTSTTNVPLNNNNNNNLFYLLLLL